MSNLKNKENERLRKKFGMSKNWCRSSMINVAQVCCSVEPDMSEDLLWDGRYPFKVLYADDTVSDEPQEGKVPLAVVLSPRYALMLVKPENRKIFRKSFNEAMALTQENVLGYKATLGSREFWKIMVGMNDKELGRLRQQMVHLGSVPLGNCCWIADALDDDYAWQASFYDKALATCRKCYENDVWLILEL